jgi:exosome complex RNA-binding protein Rrp42 (RNase PH superfamily)
LHTFRHSFISHALPQGIPEAMVRQWMGHVDQEVLRHYTHIVDAASQAAMQRLSAAQLILPTQPEAKPSAANQEIVSVHFQHSERSRENL